MKEEILDIRFEHQDLGDVSIREFFGKLCMTVWLEEEGFSGKRAFGNSGWNYDLYECLETNNLIDEGDDADEFIIDNILKPLFGV